eukprot:SAG31_NODE_707_length_12684_cov_16.884863_6_plen_145_part_00
MAHPPRPQPPPQPPPQQPQRPAGDINVQAWLDGAVEPSQLIHQSLDSVGGPLRVDSAGLRHQGGDTDTFWQQVGKPVPTRSQGSAPTLPFRSLGRELERQKDESLRHAAFSPSPIILSSCVQCWTQENNIIGFPVSSAGHRKTI